MSKILIFRFFFDFFFDFFFFFFDFFFVLTIDFCFLP